VVQVLAGTKYFSAGKLIFGPTILFDEHYVSRGRGVQLTLDFHLVPIYLHRRVLKPMGNFVFTRHC